MASLERLLKVLEALRRAILGFMAAFLLLCVPGWFYRAELLLNLKGLLGADAVLYETFVGEGLWSGVLIIVFLSAAILIPVIFLYSLRKCHVKGAVPLAVSSAVLLWGGIVFTRLALLPMTVRFLMETAWDVAEVHLAMFSYVCFCLGMMLAIGIVFEMPLLLFVMSRFGFVKADKLRGMRGQVILGMVIVLAILTPSQDVITLLIACIPVWLLYELTILVLTLSERRLQHAKA